MLDHGQFSATGCDPGVSYTDNLTSNASCVPPLTWSVISRNLPLGVTLDVAGGLISGTASGVGTYNLAVQLTDSAAHTNSSPFSLTVNPATNAYGSWMIGRAAGAATAK